jgi:hypothetical protein
MSGIENVLMSESLFDQLNALVYEYGLIYEFRIP